MFHFYCTKSNPNIHNTWQTCLEEVAVTLYQYPSPPFPHLSDEGRNAPGINCDWDRPLKSWYIFPNTRPRNGRDAILVFIHLVTFTLCQALQTPRFERTDHSPDSSEMHGTMKQTYIRQTELQTMMLATGERERCR